jgi:hypothetical protein
MSIALSYHVPRRVSACAVVVPSRAAGVLGAAADATGTLSSISTAAKLHPAKQNDHSGAGDDGAHRWR